MGSLWLRIPWAVLSPLSPPLDSVIEVSEPRLISQELHQYLGSNGLPQKEEVLLVLQSLLQIFVYAKCPFISPKV